MSREAELYKDKIEVSLDGRQIFYLFFGGAVIVGLVFVLGVMVGRRVEARGHTDRARVAATVDPLAALDRLEGGSGLSFQGALRGGEGPVSDVEKTINAMPKKDDKKSDKPKQEEVKKDEPKAEAPKLDKKADEPKVEKKADEPKVEKKADEPKVEKKADEPKVEKKSEAKLEAKKDEPKVEQKVEKKSDVKVEPKKEEVKKDEPKVADKKDEPKAKFTLQLSSFQDKSEAQAYLESLKGAGAYITEGAVDGKQYYRVRMGSYKTMEAANDAKAQLEKTTKKTAVVMKTQ
jgi:cell division protein FtsN